MIAGFEKTGDLKDQPSRGRKLIPSDVDEDVATTIIKQSMDNVVGFCSTRVVSQHLSVPKSTVQNVLRKIVHFYLYEIRYNR